MEIYLILGSIAAAIALFTFASTIGRRAWNFFRQVAYFLSDWFGETARPGVPSRPGVMERLDCQDKVLEEHTRKLGDISTRLVTVENELKPNTGKSVKDAVNRIDQNIQNITGGES